MEYHDKVLKCADCGAEFVFTAGEQMFFVDKGFKNEPKRCKACKGTRAQGADSGSRAWPCALKPRPCARNAGKRPRFRSSRRKAGLSTAASASSTAVR
jgi:hypothetical protein